MPPDLLAAALEALRQPPERPRDPRACPSRRDLPVRFLPHRGHEALRRRALCGAASAARKNTKRHSSSLVCAPAGRRECDARRGIARRKALARGFRAFSTGLSLGHERRECSLSSIVSPTSRGSPQVPKHPMHLTHAKSALRCGTLPCYGPLPLLIDEIPNATNPANWV